MPVTWFQITGMESCPADMVSRTHSYEDWHLPSHAGRVSLHILVQYELVSQGCWADLGVQGRHEAVDHQ